MEVKLTFLHVQSVLIPCEIRGCVGRLYVFHRCSGELAIVYVLGSARVGLNVFT